MYVCMCAHAGDVEANNQKVIIWCNDALIKLQQMIAFVDFLSPELIHGMNAVPAVYVSIIKWKCNSN